MITMLDIEGFNLFIKDYFLNNKIEDLEFALKFDDIKKNKAKKLAPIIKENIDYIIKEFYEYNLNNDKIKKYFKGHAEIERLMKVNQKYFEYIFSGPFDIEYYKEKIKIGYMHYIRSIPNDAYLASLGNLNSILNKLWQNKFTDVIELFEAQSITSDLLFIEIYFTVNTYYTFIEKKLSDEKTKMKEILDNMQDCYFIINKDLMTSDVVSKSCLHIFNNDISGRNIIEVFDELEVSKKDIFILSIKQYFENIFNLESIFNMLPGTIEVKNKTIKMSYTPILDSDKKPHKIIICCSDITEHIKKQKFLEEYHTKNLTIIEIIKKRTEFDQILKEIAVKNVTLLDCDDITIGKNILFEYKNYFSKFALSNIATLTHNLELELLEKEKNEKFNAKEFFSISCCMISDLLKKFLEENYEILGIPS
ncbi:hypothetical protein GCL60_00750 [Silvanigrella paludirubra]|uniref:Globin-sensor domain-containing protein n=2 Tax=Silvanigrella paludirubra TaxID=2499159 RepID=A0A6N6VZ09_9BACT|nr:hypothetical protein GCL60_00750 [Silvanigrella paludirubra]